ncbi:MAG: ASCH domain-containing protein [Ruminococcus sp.]|nr:ASCH domain-containing protein [Ruminococcus sp.]
MQLREEPFRKIYSGTKTVELRLNDEKRKKVKTGDFIEFSLNDNPDKKILVEVIALYHFNSFAELFNAIPKKKMGYSPEEYANADDMNDYYSKEKQSQYGVLGIEFIKH